MSETSKSTGKASTAKSAKGAAAGAVVAAQTNIETKTESQTLTSPLDDQTKALVSETMLGELGDDTLPTTQAVPSGDSGLSTELGILGAFKVRAKSPQGFWRSGVQFLRSKDTYVLVVETMPQDQPQVVAQEGIEPELILFMPKEKAKRVHQEPNLVVEDVDVSDVIDVTQE